MNVLPHDLMQTDSNVLPHDSIQTDSMVLPHDSIQTDPMDPCLCHNLHAIMHNKDALNVYLDKIESICKRQNAGHSNVLIPIS